MMYFYNKKIRYMFILMNTSDEVIDKKRKD